MDDAAVLDVEALVGGEFAGHGVGGEGGDDGEGAGGVDFEGLGGTVVVGVADLVGVETAAPFVAVAFPGAFGAFALEETWCEMLV